jgi:hypothetical protein
MNRNTVGADEATQIGARQVPVEPMVRCVFCGFEFRYCFCTLALSAQLFLARTYVSSSSHSPTPQDIIMNLGLSENFGFTDFAHLTFPAVMRVYQNPENVNVNVG